MTATLPPVATALEFPPDYGVKPDSPLDWSGIRARLEQAPAYWLATTRADGRPHTVPLDGIWVDDVWWYGGAAQAVHVRTVAHNPGVVMHLPDTASVVIVEGVVRRVTVSPERAERLAKVSNDKYGYGQTADAYRDSLGLHPDRVLAWELEPSPFANATRFTFLRERGEAAGKK